MESDIKPGDREELSELRLLYYEVVQQRNRFAKEAAQERTTVTRLRAEVDEAGIARLKAEERAHDLEADLAIAEAQVAAAYAAALAANERFGSVMASNARLTRERDEAVGWETCENCNGEGWFPKDRFNDKETCVECGGSGKTRRPPKPAAESALAAATAERDAALASARAEGMVLVPREPMPEMIGAWYRYKNGHHFPGETPPADTSDYGAYRAMIAAALRKGEPG